MPPKKRIFPRQKVCRFCADKSLVIDYMLPKEVKLFQVAFMGTVPSIKGNSLMLLKRQGRLPLCHMPGLRICRITG
jgi:hypothetical protein